MFHALIRLKSGLLIRVVASAVDIVSNNNTAWELQFSGRQTDPHKGETLDMESRLHWSEQFVRQHDREIRQTRDEAAHITQELGKRIQGQGQQIRKQERLIRFLSEVLSALVAVLFAGLVAAYIDGDIYWKAVSGLIGFMLMILAGKFVFKALDAPKKKKKLPPSPFGSPNSVLVCSGGERSGSFIRRNSRSRQDPL